MMPLKLAEECRMMYNARQAGRNEMHQVCVRFGTLALGTQNTTLYMFCLNIILGW